MRRGIAGALALPLIACNMPNPAYGPPVTGTGSDTDIGGSSTSAGPGTASDGGGSGSGGATAGVATSDALTTGPASSTTGPDSTTDVDPSLPDTGDTNPGCDGEPCEPGAPAECVNFYTFEACEGGCLAPSYCAEAETCHPNAGDNGADCLENAQCDEVKNIYLEHYSPPGDPDNKCYTDDECTVLNLGCNLGVVECHAVNLDAADEAEALMLDWEDSGCFLGECPACDEVQVKCQKEMPDNQQLEGVCVTF